MRVRPLENYELLGTQVTLDKTKVYDAVPATNQPDWKAKGLIFVDVPVRLPTSRSQGESRFMLLNKDEYIDQIPWAQAEAAIAKATGGGE